MRPIDADDLHVDYLVPSTTTMTKCYEYVSKAQINNAPTIKAAPVKHGRWETADDGNIYCSCCGDSWASRLEHIVKVRFGYCPYCSAKMEGVERGMRCRTR